MGGGKIEYLRPLRRYYTQQLLGYLFLALSFSVGVGFLTVSFTSELLGLSSGLIVALVSSVLISMKFGKDATECSEFLARAILYVSADNVGIAAPEPKSLPASNDFFAELAKNVYNMASASFAKSITPDESDAKPTKMIETLLQHSPIAIFVVNGSSNLVYLNPSAERYTTISPKQAIGRPLHESLKLTFDTSQTLEEWLKDSQSKVATSVQTWDRVKITLESNKVRYCDMAVRFNKDNPDGVEVVVMLFDHTDKYLNDEHGVGTISMAVHELRTPITAMRGYIEVFEEEVTPKLNEEQKQFMRALSAQAQQLGSFISNIQNFAKIEENAMTLRLKSEDWGSIVNGAVEDMKLRALVRKKTVVSEIPKNMPQVAVDKVTINEVLTNLIENAIKYTHSSEPIVVACKQINKDFIETTVTDKGIGIPKALLGNLFERFYRSHRSSASIGGMGLGLYLSKSIVTAHGGDIWVKSVEGQGSTFGFTVPTFESLANSSQIDKNNSIVRSAHGWIKNHNLYRG